MVKLVFIQSIKKILIKYLESKNKDDDIAAFVAFLLSSISQDEVIIADGD